MVAWRYTEKPMMPGRVLTLILWVFMVGLSAAPESATSDANLPVWKRDLVLGLDPRHTETLQDSNRAGVTFLSNQQLLVYAVYRNSEELSSRESPEFASPFRLHVWTVDSQSGDVQTHNEWKTRVHDSAVQVTSGGVLVKTGGIVRLYLPGFTEIRNLPLTWPLEGNAQVSTHVSPTGKTFVIDRPLRAPNDKPWSNPGYNHLEVFDAASLKTRYSWSISPQLYGRYSISDVAVVHSPTTGRTIHSARFGGSRWDVIFDDPSRTCVFDSPIAIPDESVVLHHCKDLTVITSPGVSYSLSIDLGSSRDIQKNVCEAYAGSNGDKTTVALGSQVIALSLPALKYKAHFLTEGRLCLTALRVVVFDLAHKKQIFTVNLNPVPKSDYDFALSPDGSKLAVLNDRQVAVYAMPSPM